MLAGDPDDLGELRSGGLLDPRIQLVGVVGDRGPFDLRDLDLADQFELKVDELADRGFRCFQTARDGLLV